MHGLFIETDVGDFQHYQISLIWKVTNNAKSNMYITPVLFESQTGGLPAVTLPSFELSLSDALVLQDSESGRQEPSLTLAPLQFEMKL